MEVGLLLDENIKNKFLKLTGMSLLADTYPDDKERSKAMGLALSGIALGVLSKYGGTQCHFF